MNSSGSSSSTTNKNKNVDGLTINKNLINRKNLSHLFVGFLNLNDEINSNKILETIHKQYSNPNIYYSTGTGTDNNNNNNSFLNQYEINEIIKKLLTSHNDIIKSLELIENLSWNHCKWSYLEIFNYILVNATSEQQKDVEKFLKDFQLRLVENFKNEIFLEELTIIILKHISIMDNRDAIRLYNKILKLSSNTSVVLARTSSTSSTSSTSFINNKPNEPPILEPQPPPQITNNTRGNLNTSDISLFEYLNIEEIFDKYTLKSRNKKLRKSLLINERIKYLPDWLINKNYLKLINKNSMIKICLNLLIQSIIEKDYYCIIWLFDELRKFGWRIEDILWYCNSYDLQDYLQEIINEKVLLHYKLKYHHHHH